MPALRSFILGSMLLALTACSGRNQGPPDIEVRDGWTREIAPGQSAAAIYLTIVNRGSGGDLLTTVDSAVGQATLHATTSSDGVARMRPLEDGVEVAPGSTVALKPGATHIMVTGLTNRPSVGETIQLNLGFQRSGKRPVAIRVVAAGGDGHSEHGMKM